MRLSEKSYKTLKKTCRRFLGHIYTLLRTVSSSTPNFKPGLLFQKLPDSQTHIGWSTVESEYFFDRQILLALLYRRSSVPDLPTAFICRQTDRMNKCVYLHF